MRYLLNDIEIHKGQWTNDGGADEWDEVGSNPLNKDAIREDKNVECCFLDDVCVNIGTLSEAYTLTGREEFKLKTTHTNPITGRVIFDG